MNRRDFLKSLGIIATALAVSPDRTLANLIVPITPQDEIEIIRTEILDYPGDFCKLYRGIAKYKGKMKYFAFKLDDGVSVQSLAKDITLQLRVAFGLTPWTGSTLNFVVDKGGNHDFNPSI